MARPDFPALATRDPVFPETLAPDCDKVPEAVILAVVAIT